jgi:putative membrane protein
VSGEELATLSRLWQASTRTEPALIHDVPVSGGNETQTDGALIYRSSAKDLFIAGFAYGQFAIVGVGAVVGLADVLDAVGISSMGALSSLGPVVLGMAALTAAVFLGFVITYLRYAGFEVRTHLQSGVVIRYGLLSRHERFLDGESIAGVVLQRNLAEMVLGRIRLSLLTADSTAQLGSNLVLPSLPLRVVACISSAAFGDRTTTNPATGSRFPLVLSSVLWIAATFGVSAIVMLAVARTTDYPAYMVLACGAVMLAGVYGVGRALVSRLAVQDQPGLVTVRTTHISERLTTISMPAVHMVTMSSIAGIARVVRIYFYAGMPRRLTCLFFTTEDVLNIQRQLVELSPSVALKKRERNRGRD